MLGATCNNKSTIRTAVETMCKSEASVLFKSPPVKFEIKSLVLMSHPKPDTMLTARTKSVSQPIAC